MTTNPASERGTSTFKSTILITGGTSGLGQETATQLAHSFPDKLIVITGRSPRGVQEAINRKTRRDNVVFMKLDLSTEADVRDFVKRYSERSFPPIESLVLNAALQFVDSVHLTTDGIEESFAVNHVHHSLVFFLLKHRLNDTARIVVVGSKLHDPAHKQIPLDPVWTSVKDVARPTPQQEDDVRNEGWRRYGLSKAANILFTHALTSEIRSQGKGWTTLILDPGVMPTNLFRSLGPALGFVFKIVLKSPAGKLVSPDAVPVSVSAAQLCKMITEPTFAGDGVNGKQYDMRGRETQTSDVSYDERKQQELWDWTIDYLGQNEGEKAQFRAI